MAKFPIPTLRSAPTPLPSIDLNRLANEIAKKPSEVVAYAPPSQRPDAIDRTIEQVHMFGDLPTKELDDIILAAENEIAALKADAQAIRDMYVKHTERVVNDVQRLSERSQTFHATDARVAYSMRPLGRQRRGAHRPRNRG